MRAANRVVLNTGVVYFRLLLTIVISLYTTRLVLNALGASDYGVFNLIGGIIAMLSFLNAAMAASTQRYLSFYRGKADATMQRKVFANSFLIHFFIGILIICLLEGLGAFLFNGFLKIPVARLSAAKFIYHFMSLTVFFTVLSVPFTAALNARENMTWTALVNVFESFLKLGIAILLLRLNSDRLILYGVLTAGISIVSFTLYSIYCLRKYDECSITTQSDYEFILVKELTFFAGWNLFGTLAGVARIQGLAIVLNIFFGAVVNAAYGIANQVSGQLVFFSTTMMRVLDPQIMKSEGANDRQRMLRLSMMGSKFCFFLLAFVAIPCIFEMPGLLTLWLTNVPNYTVTFCNLILIAMLTNQLTIGLQSAFQATGKIKFYQAIVGTVLMLNLPIAYILLRMSFPFYSVLISYIMIELIACIIRVIMLRKIAGMSATLFVRRVIAKEIIPIAISLITCYIIVHFVKSFELRFLITGVLSSLAFAVSIYLFGLCKDEKDLINQIIFKAYKKFGNG